jgi:hypothetical protein
MKNLFVLLFLALSLTTWAQWEMIEDEPPILGGVTIIDLAVANDSIYVAYKGVVDGEFNMAGCLVYDENEYIDLRLTDPLFEGKPCISGNSNSHLYMTVENHFLKYTNGNWEQLDDYIDFTPMNSMDLMVVDDNNIYASFIQHGSERRPQIRKYDGTSWSEIGGTFVEDILSEDEIRLAIHPNGGICMVHAGQDGIRVLQFNGNNWELVGSPNFAISRTGGYSLGITSIGTYLVSTIEGNDEILKVYAYGNGFSDWTSLEIPAGVNGLNKGTAIATDENGIAAIVGTSPLNSNTLLFNGSSLELMDFFEYSVGANFEVGLQFKGNDLFVAFSNQSWQPSVMKYPNFAGDHSYISEKDIDRLELWPNPAIDQLSITTPIDGIITILDLFGNVILENKINNQPTEKINIGSLASGMYIAQIKDSHGRITHLSKFTKE